LTPANCSRKIEDTSAGLISAMISAGVQFWFPVRIPVRNRVQ
jgi:hypothetical protein